METPNFYQVLLDTEACPNTYDGETQTYRFKIPPEPGAPIIDGDWRGGVHFAFLKEIERKPGRSTVGLISRSFLGGGHNKDEAVVLCSDVCKPETAATTSFDYSMINDHAYFNLKNPYLFRSGGELDFSVVHIDRANTNGDFDEVDSHEAVTCIIRFEKIRGFESCKCQRK